MALGSALSANNVLTELAASNGYARQPVQVNYDPVAGVMSVSGATFGPDVTSAWSAATYAAIFDASSNGNMIASFPIPSTTLAVGQSYTVPSFTATLNGTAKGYFVGGGLMPPGTVMGTITDLLATGLTGAIMTSGPASLAYSAAGALSASSVVVQLAYAPTVTPNGALGTTFDITLTGNLTLNPPAGAVPGTSYRFFLTQDGTGSRTLTLGTGFKTAGGAPTLSTAANAVDRYTAFYDGTTFWGDLFKAFG
jgi:hypothetical protein